MTKHQNANFGGVSSNQEQPPRDTKSMSGAVRFLKRATGLGERNSRDSEEKTLRWIDPIEAGMWVKHNRDYALLNAENCRDLIDGIKSQGRQEFPAIVRMNTGQDKPYEVICGARRHFAISWLREQNLTQFKFLVEVRNLTDEGAFRLADIENRDRADISDFERAIDYAQAVELYYDGRQKSMAVRLEVSEAWLSRYLHLAKLPDSIIAAFFQKTEIKELHARTLKPLLANPKDRKKVEQVAAELAREQQAARQGQGVPLDSQKVMARLKSALGQSRPKVKKPNVVKIYPENTSGAGMAFIKKGRKNVLEFPETMSRAELGEAFQQFMNEHFPAKLPIGKKRS